MNANEFGRCRSWRSIIPQWITTHQGSIGGNVGTLAYPREGSVPDAAYLPMGMSGGKLFSGGRLRRSGWIGVSSSDKSGRLSFFLIL